MKSPFGLLILGLICALGSAFCWHLASVEQDIASTGVLLLTLRYDAAAQNAAKTTPSVAPDSSLKVARQLRATADYWSQQYSKLTGPKTSNEDSEQRDVEELFIASNAAYREWQSRAERGNPQASLEQLETVIKTYADVTKRQPENEDAAYNYEFAVRKREMLAGKAKATTTHPPSDRPTIHGRPGSVPSGNGSSEFKIIIPKQPDERKEDNTPGKAQKITKKG